MANQFLPSTTCAVTLECQEIIAATAKNYHCGKAKALEIIVKEWSELDKAVESLLDYTDKICLPQNISRAKTLHNLAIHLEAQRWTGV